MTPLKEYCKMTKSQLWKKFESEGFILKNGYAFKDNNANVLAVAHLDISPAIQNLQSVYSLNEHVVYSPALDDRLGIYTILEILLPLGINFDILITDFEEIGQSTAKNFETSKIYNWMFQFDRSGTDVVLYDYETEQINNAVKDSKFKIGTGSFSDISSLDHLKCCGLNFGTAYYDEHTSRCRANLIELQDQVRKFKTFFDTNADIHFIPEFDKYSDNTYTKYGYWDEYQCEIDDEIDEICIELGSDNPWIPCDFCETSYHYIELTYHRREDSVLCKHCEDSLGLNTISIYNTSI